jgi:hypothetical protein
MTDLTPLDRAPAPRDRELSAAGPTGRTTTMGIPRWRKPYLRDAATICTAVLNVPGDPMRCELDAGHDGKHKSGCTKWATRTP